MLAPSITVEVENMKVTIAWLYAAADVSNFGVVGFQVQRKPGATSDPGAWATIATPGATFRSFDDSAVSPGTTYSYRVVAIASGGNSDPSAPAQVTTVALPPAPAAPTLTASA